MKDKNIIEFETECYNSIWRPYLLKFRDKGVSVEIDTDIEFPMLQEELHPIQKGKKYKVTIQEVENGS